MQAFYVKKEKKLSNDCHKINAGNQSNFHKNMKDNELYKGDNLYTERGDQEC